MNLNTLRKILIERIKSNHSLIKEIKESSTYNKNLLLILAKIETNVNPEQCWHWMNKYSYIAIGNYIYNGKKYKKYITIRQFLYQLVYDLSPEQKINTTCNNSKCINPDHFLVVYPFDYNQTKFKHKELANYLNVGTNTITRWKREQIIIVPSSKYQQIVMELTK